MLMKLTPVVKSNCFLKNQIFSHESISTRKIQWNPLNVITGLCYQPLNVIILTSHLLASGKFKSLVYLAYSIIHFLYDSKA